MPDAFAGPTSDEGILLFFSKPDRHVLIRFRVVEGNRFYLSVEDGKARGGSTQVDDSYFIALTNGPAGELHSDVGGRGPGDDPSLERHGIAVNAVRSPDGSTVATRHASHDNDELTDDRGATYHFDLLSNLTVKHAVVGSVGMRDSYSASDLNVTGRLPASTLSRTQSAVAGTIPPIAAPESLTGVMGNGALWPERIGSVEMGNQLWFPPRQVDFDVAVEVESLSGFDARLGGDYQVVSATPALLDSKLLEWQAQDRRRFQASWLAVSQRARDEGDNALFLAGILFGAAFGFASVAFENLVLGALPFIVTPDGGAD